jgi:transcription-repair coupling factor (superfamily II helicase)
LLSANGYARTETVHDAGEFAVRGGIVDLFPAGEEEGLRLDFFGDEIETVRRFDPAASAPPAPPKASLSCPPPRPCWTRRA